MCVYMKPISARCYGSFQHTMYVPLYVFPNCQGLMHLVMCREATSNVKGPAFGPPNDVSRAVYSGFSHQSPPPRRWRRPCAWIQSRAGALYAKMHSIQSCTCPALYQVVSPACMQRVQLCEHDWHSIHRHCCFMHCHMRRQTEKCAFSMWQAPMLQQIY